MPDQHPITDVPTTLDEQDKTQRINALPEPLQHLTVIQEKSGATAVTDRPTQTNHFQFHQEYITCQISSTALPTNSPPSTKSTRPNASTIYMLDIINPPFHRRG
jgi:hypothetical protein